jgi:hypothetical protein
MRMILELVISVVPFILLGYLIGRVRLRHAPLFVKAFVDFSLYFLVPVFIFFVMWAAPLKENLYDTGAVVLVSVAVVGAGLIFAAIYSRAFNAKFREAALPIVFMNSAYLAIPINTALGGSRGVFLSTVYNIVITFLHFSVGILIVSGSSKEILRLPVMYAGVVGLLLNLSGVPLGHDLSVFSSLLQKVTLPVMLCLVGYQIKPVSMNMLRDVLAGVAVRMVGGLLVALAICELFGIIGVTRQVCLLTSAMPSAVNTYMLSEKYDANSSFASSMITAGLFVSPILLSVIIWLM